MTVSSTTNRNSFTCTGVKEFPFDFKIFAKTDLVVILRDSEGNETTLTLTTDYTISAGPWENGGTLTTVKTYTSGTLVIIRELPQTQGMDYVENDPFPADTHEQGLDRGVMILQELTEKIDRALLLLKSSSYSELSLPDPVASKLLAWKDDLSGIKNVEIKSQGDLSVTDYIKTLLDDEDAAAARATLGMPIISPLSIPPGVFVPFYDNQDWQVTYRWLKNRTSLDVQSFGTSVYLPHGATVTKTILYGYRDVNEASSILSFNMKGTSRGATDFVMSTMDALWYDGYNSQEDTTIENAVIDNINKHYSVTIGINPFESVDDTFFTGAVIEFTLP